MIKGTVVCDEDTFFELAVPYDEGFTVTVDGRGQIYECVDEAFIGFPLGKGEHVIEFRYKAPLLTAGKLMSLAGVLSFAALTVWEIVSARKKKNKAEAL